MQKNERRQEHKSAKHVCMCALMICALILAGCAQPQPQTPTGRIYVPDIGKARTMAVAEDVLANMHFAIEKADTASGLIRTRPLSGAQFFEFWRCDNIGSDRGLAANLHTIRRTVELNISRQDEEVCIGCSVRVQRLSLPERDIRSNARAYEMFSRSSPSLLRLRLYPEQQENMVWLELGNDVLLAEEILRRIEAQMASQASSSLQVTGNRT
ncbi:MAG: hypothetical protein JSW66_10715 [Phycisphaerales bacterium]|nr:MAG: hypothetical protein JSW66_10715 [Phycisphaerales bacterium]